MGSNTGYPRQVDSYLQTPRGSIHVRDYGGTGTPIVLVHGLGGSKANWDAIGLALSDLGHTVAIDLPGFGLSPPGDDWGLDTHSTAVHWLIDELGAPAILVGNSMGALVSEMVASDSPGSVAALVLMSPATPPRFPDPRIHWPTARRLAIQATPGLGRAVTRYFLSRYTPEELVRFSLATITHDPDRVPEPIVEEFIDLAWVRSNLPWTEEAVSGSGRSIARAFARRSRFVEMIRGIRAPTLVVHGLSDHIVSPTSVEWLCSLRPDWELVQMEDTGHTPQLDAAERTLGILLPWIQGVLKREIAL